MVKRVQGSDFLKMETQELILYELNGIIQYKESDMIQNREEITIYAVSERAIVKFESASEQDLK